MAAQFYPSDDEADNSFEFEDPYLGLGDDPSLFHEDTWWRGRDLDALADDPDWAFSFEGRHHLEHQRDELNRQIDAQAELGKHLPPSRWELLMEEEDILECMFLMFIRAEDESTAKSFKI